MSTEKVLIASNIKESQRHLFTDLGVEIFTPDSFDPANITIMYGWNADLGNRILRQPGAQLKWVHAISAGVDSLPLAEFEEKGIQLTNASGIHAEGISQSVMAYILYFVRSLNSSRQNQALKRWVSQSQFEPYTISDLTYVIFGTGHIGQQIARLLKAMGATTLGVNTTGHPATNFDQTIAFNQLDDRVWTSDVVVNVMPLDHATAHFFNQAFFDHFADLFLFINVGRGPSVDSAALISALESGTVQHAALDVFEQEPLPDDSPFWTLDNVVVTPHNTGVIKHFKDAQLKLFIPNLKQYLQDGTFVSNQVNLKKGY